MNTTNASLWLMADDVKAPFFTIETPPPQIPRQASRPKYRYWFMCSRSASKTLENCMQTDRRKDELAKDPKKRTRQRSTAS